MLARIENNTVAEQRDIAIEAVPEHKRALWRPIVGEKPAYIPALETISGPVLAIHPDRVERQWTVARRPLDEQRAAVKAECRRRILALFPEWRQTNMATRGQELQALTRAWTEDEAVEWSALQAVWAWITAMRSRSDQIELLDPIPADYTADVRWPALAPLPAAPEARTTHQEIAALREQLAALSASLAALVNQAQQP